MQKQSEKANQLVAFRQRPTQLRSRTYFLDRRRPPSWGGPLRPKMISKKLTVLHTLCIETNAMSIFFCSRCLIARGARHDHWSRSCLGGDVLVAQLGRSGLFSLQTSWGPSTIGLSYHRYLGVKTTQPSAGGIRDDVGSVTRCVAV